MLKSNKYIIPVFISHLGCNNECVFCNQRKISGTQKPVKAEDVENIILQYLEYFSNNQNKDIELAFFGGSFTGIEIEKQIEYLEVVQKYIQNKEISSIRISTRPDYINQDILDVLKKYNVKTIELGVQSLDSDVLLKAKRGHTVEDVEKASNLINKNGFILGHQIMVGLPNSTLEKEIKSVEKSIKMNPKIIRIYPVLVIAKTELEEMFYNKEYKPLELEEAVERSAIITNMYNDKNIQVIRTGLHVTEDLASESSYVSGPIHPAFGQMVKSRIILKKVEKEIDKLDYKSANTIVIECKMTNINYIVGVKKANLEYLKNKYKKNVKVQINRNIKYEYKCKVM